MVNNGKNIVEKSNQLLFGWIQSSLCMKKLMAGSVNWDTVIGLRENSTITQLNGQNDDPHPKQLTLYPEISASLRLS